MIKNAVGISMLSYLKHCTFFDYSIALNYNQLDRIWIPDLFVRNLKSGLAHTITVPNRMLRLSPDGTIFYTQRLSLTLSCTMNLERYPMDNQTCYIELGSCESFGD